MKRSPLRRSRKPLKRSRLRQKSVKQLEREARYWPARAAHLREYPWCEICFVVMSKYTDATEIHHLRGRNKSLLWDRRFFKSSCLGCRMWPHDNSKLARELGLLSPKGDWGVVPKD